MKLWAKIRINNELNAENLIRAFYKDFNPKSSITIQGDKASLEIFFEKTPFEIMNVLNESNVEDFNFGNNIGLDVCKNFDGYEELLALKKRTEEAKIKKAESMKKVLKPRIRISCLPENIFFEEKLAILDKNTKIEERVIYVFRAMGWKGQLTKDYISMIHITVKAITLKEPNFNVIFKELKTFSEEEFVNARMFLATFVNDFAGKHGATNKIKLYDFLKDLQYVVLTEKEITEIRANK